MSGALTKVLLGQYWRNKRGLVYLGIKGCEMKRIRLQGEAPFFINKQSLQGGAFSRIYLTQKSKSPLFPVCVCGWGGGGRAGVVTNDYGINKITQ